MKHIKLILLSILALSFSSQAAWLDLFGMNKKNTQQKQPSVTELRSLEGGAWSQFCAKHPYVHMAALLPLMHPQTMPLLIPAALYLFYQAEGAITSVKYTLQNQFKPFAVVTYENDGFKRNMTCKLDPRIKDQTVHAELLSRVIATIKSSQSAQLIFDPRQQESTKYSLPNHQTLTSLGFKRFTASGYQKNPDITDSSDWSQEFDKPRLDKKLETYYKNL